MKKILVLLVCFVSLAGVKNVAGQNIQSEVESRRFKFVVNQVIPSMTLDLSNYKAEGHISITDSTSSASLPYFGITHQFNNTMDTKKMEWQKKAIKDVQTEVNEKKGELKNMKFSFSVKAKDQNIYNFTMYIKKDGSCRIEFTGDNRSDIVYIGKIEAL